MAVYMLYAAIALVWVLALVQLYGQLKELKLVLPAWKAFRQDRPAVLKMQVNNGMVFFCLFMAIMGLVLCFLEKGHAIRFCFIGISLLFAGYTIKNQIEGRIYWSSDAFLWKNHSRLFRSIQRFDPINNQTTEIEFNKESPLLMPAAAAIQIQSLKTRQAAMRLKIKK